MDLRIIIALIFLMSLAGILAWYFHSKNGIARAHKQSVLDIEDAICNNNKQLAIREMNLNRYDFSKYNLREALEMQPQIRI